MLLTRLLFISCIATSPAFSQSKSKIDSLTTLLTQHPKEDIVKARVLIELSDALEKIDANKGIVYSDKALTILENFPVLELKADALRSKSRHLSDQVKRKEALELASQALKIYEQLRQKSKMANVHNILGNIYETESDNESSIVQYKRALALSDEVGDMKLKVLALNGLGVTYIALSNYKEAVANFEAAMAQKYDDPNVTALTLGNLGYGHYQLGNYARAFGYMKNAISINEYLGNDYNLAYNYRNLGFIYLRISEFDKALDYFNKSLPFSIKTDNKTLQSTIYTQIGICYKDMGKYKEGITSIEKGTEIDKKIGRDPKWLELGSVYEASGRRIEAHRCYQNALVVNTKLGNQALVAAALGNIGRIYGKVTDSSLIKMGINPSDRFPTALKYATQAYELSVKIASPRRIANALGVIQNLHEKNKDYENAYKSFKLLVALNDSLSGEEVKGEITREEIQYEFDKKKTELKYQQQLTADELEKQRLLTFQQGQALRLNQQNLTLKEQALTLSNKEKDLAHLAYLKEQAEKQEKVQALSLSQEREKGKERDLSLKNLELSAQQKQNVYLGLLVASMLVGLGTLSYYYTTLKKQKNIISQQNELNEQTINILSHDIKEPLLGVKLLLKKLNTDDPFVAQASHSLEGQINSVNGILTNLLKMKKASLIKNDKNAIANANTVVKNVIQELNVAIQSKDLTIQNELSEDLTLSIAPEKLQIVVHNLLSNAVKYSFPNQTIRIFKEGKGFSIQDFGIGLSPEKRTKLMREVTASERGTNQEYGNGLGLFLIGALLQGEQLKVIFDSPEVGGTIAKVLG